jgi:hypothetical protein
MPEWHAAPPRNTGAAAGFGAAVTGRGAAAEGLAGAGKGCCAGAADESASNAATPKIAIRMPDKITVINITGSRAKFTGFPHSLKSAEKEIGRALADGSVHENFLCHRC